MSKGSLSLQKRMNFRKSSEWVGGSFPIQKFMLQIFAIIKGTLVMNFGEKNPQHDFPKMRRGVKSRLKLFQKFICFGIRSHLLILAVLHKEILYVLYFLDDIPHHDIISIFSLSEPFYKYISRYF